MNKALLIAGVMLVAAANPEKKLDKAEVHNICNPGVTGQGVGIILGDLGRIDTTHQEFVGRRVTSLEGRGPENHGMVDATILVGNGLKPRVAGVAPNAHLIKVHQLNAWFYIDNYLPLYPEIEISVNPYQQGGNSGDYNYHANQQDEFAVAHPDVLFIWPVGNKSQPAMEAAVAHNVLSVGKATYDEVNGYMIHQFGSHGATDGSLKPEIMALQLFRGAGASKEYVWLGGSSQSAVTVAGAAALMEERYQALFQDEMPATLLKNVLCNGADLMNDNNDRTPRLDPRWGFGSLNVCRALGIIEGGNITPIEMDRDDLTSFTLEDQCVDHGTWKVMVSWEDAPGAGFQSEVYFSHNQMKVGPMSNIMTALNVEPTDELSLEMTAGSVSDSETVWVTWCLMTEEGR